MRVLGIDCGSEVTGFGIVEQSRDRTLHCIVCGAIRLSPKQALPTRLAELFQQLSEVITSHSPQVVAIEDIFYAANAKSALKLGHVRGVAMLAAASFELQVAEYAPLAIKSAVVGYGRAEKSQVQQMVAHLLRLPQPPEPADVADALAIAICHLHTSATLLRQKAASVS